MKKIKFLAVVLSAIISLSVISSFAASGANTITVVTATSTASTKLSALNVSASGLFCGWFTSESAAKSLDTASAAKNGYVGTVYGAVLSMDSSSLTLDGVQMRTTAPEGIRFLATIDKDIIETVESLNDLNRYGKNGTFNPANEYNNGIGYGMVLSIDVDTESALVKKFGDNVKEGITVPGVYTFADDSNTLTYTATVLGIDTASLADKIAARPYITYADANGNERTVYYTESGSANCAYAASLYDIATSVNNDSNASAADKTAASELLATYSGTPYTTKKSISDFNTLAKAGSADNDNAYVEFDRSSIVENLYKRTDINPIPTYSYRWRTCYYPRITKIRDDLYLMTVHYGTEGQHVYYTTSTDGGKTWPDLKLLYDASQAKNKFTYTSGSLSGTADTYFGVNADHCLLKDGTILCVYSRRPNLGYTRKEYTSFSTLEIVRGTVKGDEITWSEPQSIYYGQNWEAEIIQRENGQIDIYWTHVAPMIFKYGFHAELRSTGVAMISSNDNGYTWTPNITASDYLINPTDAYAAKRVFQFSAGTLTSADGETYSAMHCQMPGVVEMLNGKMMVVSETRSVGESSHMISKGYSEENGVWNELGAFEQGPWNTKFKVFKGAAPSLMRFDSGEILMTYNYASNAYCRLMNTTGTNMTAAHALNVFGVTNETAGGFWSGSSPLDSHTAMIAMTHERYLGREPYIDPDDGLEKLNNTTILGKVRLNHTIDATKKNMVADGNLQEWSSVNEALFIGSASKTVQATYRFAYDDDYVYVAIDRTDSSNNANDNNIIRMTTSSGYITASMTSGTSSLPAGVTAGTKTATGGRVYEFAFDRAALGLTGDYVRVCPGFTDYATDSCASEDIINGMSTTDTSTWIKINIK